MEGKRKDTSPIISSSLSNRREMAMKSMVRSELDTLGERIAARISRWALWLPLVPLPIDTHGQSCQRCYRLLYPGDQSEDHEIAARNRTLFSLGIEIIE